jgi:uncharacterized protein YjbJ (UPF0337 family)
MNNDIFKGNWKQLKGNAKAKWGELTDDDRATLYGALLDLAGRARGDDAGDVLALWKRRGKRAFDAEGEAKDEA